MFEISEVQLYLVTTRRDLVTTGKDIENEIYFYVCRNYEIFSGINEKIFDSSFLLFKNLIEKTFAFLVAGGGGGCQSHKTTTMYLHVDPSRRRVS